MEAAKFDEHKFYWEGANVLGDSIMAAVCGGRIELEINQPWAGDTESGFGRTTSISLPCEVAVQLAAWLLARCGAAMVPKITRVPE